MEELLTEPEWITCIFFMKTIDSDTHGVFYSDLFQEKLDVKSILDRWSWLHRCSLRDHSKTRHSQGTSPGPFLTQDYSDGETHCYDWSFLRTMLCQRVFLSHSFSFFSFHSCQICTVVWRFPQPISVPSSSFILHRQFHSKSFVQQIPSWCLVLGGPKLI